jgi:hypothetical protein
MLFNSTTIRRAAYLPALTLNKRNLQKKDGTDE